MTFKLPASKTDHICYLWNLLLDNRADSFWHCGMGAKNFLIFLDALSETNWEKLTKPTELWKQKGREVLWQTNVRRKLLVPNERDLRGVFEGIQLKEIYGWNANSLRRLLI